MSDFLPRDMVADLWEEILKRHWSFLETDESPQKIEELRKLEGCLKEFLCLVPQDRKFFLPETAHVLKKTIREMEDFTASRARIGFEAISQYANNLFTKPWRKEFRILKMYSGFFQHEIKSNLVDAEQLFIAMGYRKISDEILILDGPICPDQVTNVSRDAMAAYVECHIMKNICLGVEAQGYSCTWGDVYHIREKFIGGTSQAIKGLIYTIQERTSRKEKYYNSENSYATIQHSPQETPNANATIESSQMSQYQNYAVYQQQLQHQQQQQQQMQLQQQHQQQQQQIQLQQQQHQQQQQLLQQQQQQQQKQTQTAQHKIANGQYVAHNSNSNNNSYAMHPGQIQSNYPYSAGNAANGGTNLANDNKLMSAYPSSANYSQQSTYGAQPHMSHSRSLEHYNEPHAALPHRHSFDHQQQGCTSHQYHHQQSSGQHPNLYESPYDTIDGNSSLGSSVSYAAVAAASGGSNNVNSAYAHPYNVSGNRFPLPYNISNQLNSHYATPVAVHTPVAPPPQVSCNGVKGDPYAGVVENSYAGVVKSQAAQNYYAQQQQQQLARQNATVTSGPTSRDFQAYRQNSYPPDQLIDFVDREQSKQHEYISQLQSNSFDSERSNDVRSSRRSSRGGNLYAVYADPKAIVNSHDPSVQNHQTTHVDEICDNNHLYARPTPRGHRTKTPRNVTDKYLRNFETGQDTNSKMQMELRERLAQALANGGARKKLTSHTNEREVSDPPNEYDDFVNVCISEKPQRSPSQLSKNQDGVGSFEEWNYVFKKLERPGYNSAEVEDREDLLMQSLDLDSLNLADGAGPSNDKRRANNAPEPSRVAKEINIEKFRNYEKAFVTEKGEGKSATVPKQEKSILKQTNTNGKRPTGGMKNLMKTAGNGSLPHDNNNGYEIRELPVALQQECENNTGRQANGVIKKHKSSNSTRLISGDGSRLPTPISTQVIVSSPYEWSCNFCTFLNPNEKRVCEMCCRTKDLPVDTITTKTPTCV